MILAFLRPPFPTRTNRRPLTWAGMASAAALVAGCAGTPPRPPAPTPAAPATMPQPPATKAPAATTGDACTSATLGKAILSSRSTGTAVPGNYAKRPELWAFANAAAACYELDPGWVASVLSDAKYQPSVARLIMPPPPGGAKNWAAYRSRFVEPVRINAGIKFWNDNQNWLDLAEATYGVSPAVIVGILGVETIFGRNTGNYRVIDALTTLAFDFPAGRSDRTDYFAGELASFLALSNKANSDPMQTRGSYAGAMGLPQFMPTSLSKYAVDLDGDGRIDLLGSVPDAIGSIANYLAEHGWQRGLPPVVPVNIAPGANLSPLLAPDIRPTFSAAQMQAGGVQVVTNEHTDPRVIQGPLALVELENGGAPRSYVAGTDNFYVLTRYNRSSYYAMAVIELGQAIAASH